MKKYNVNPYHEFKKNRNEINFRHLLILIFPIALILGSAIVNIILLFASVIFIYDQFKNKNIYNFSFLETWIKIFIIFWIYIVFNSLFSSDNFGAFKNSFSQIRFLFFALYIYQNLNLLTFRILIYIIVVCLCFVGIDNNIQYFTGLDIFGYPAEQYSFDVRIYDLDKRHIYSIGRLSGPFKDELISGAYLSKLSFIALIYIFIKFKTKSTLSKIIQILFFFLLLESIFITGERSSSLIFITLSLIMIFYNFNYKKSILYLIILFGVLTLFIQQSKFLKYRINDTLHIVKDYKNSSYGRLTTSATNLWRKNFFTGVGLKNYRIDCINIEDPNPDHKYQYCSTHPHNTILELLSETGFIGTILFLTFLISYFRFVYSKLKKINDSNIKLFTFGLILNLFIIILPLMPAGSMFTTWNASFFWLIFGIILFLTKTKKL